jgi:hypothetical protein
LGDRDEDIKDFKFNPVTWPRYRDKLNENEYLSMLEREEKADIMGKKYQKNRLSPEDRAQFARERRAVEGSIIAQKGFEGALVLEHIRGSQYLIRMPDGTEVFASHAKQRGENQSVSTGGWSPWNSDRYV